MKAVTRGPHIVLGIGTGRCGTLAMSQLFSRQPGVRVMHESPPRLPWANDDCATLISHRLGQFRAHEENYCEFFIIGYVCSGECTCYHPTASAAALAAAMFGPMVGCSFTSCLQGGLNPAMQPVRLQA
jgi:hypothetical protein